MKQIMQKAITCLMSHADEDFVSKKDALDAGVSLHNLMIRTNDWHWIEHMLNEVDRAELKHPNWPEDKIYSLAIVGEEYGEAQREAVKIEMNEQDASKVNLKKELIQTMATCFRALKSI